VLLIENPLNESELVFPVLECIHIVGMAVALGSIALVDFAVLGLGLRRDKLPEYSKNLSFWTLYGLAAIFISGPLLFLSDPDMYYLNHSFQAKMVILLVVLIFNYTLRRKAYLADSASGQSKIFAMVSIVLWIGVIGGAIFIGFV
jgi:hypothetical protein